MIHTFCGNNAGTNDQLLARWKDVSCEYVACRENERKFLALELTKTMISIERASGRLKAVISDANRINQACFKKSNNYCRGEAMVGS